jgi:GTP-binding protein HflX
MMKRRMATLKRKVAEVSERREIFRQRRERTGQLAVTITGYTGAGKTTLFNRLTGEEKEVDAGVFTTLSPTTRGINIGDERILVSDTVGFIDRLPTYMIEAFKSTLEEVSYSDLAILLVDSSAPPEKLTVNYRSCISTLAELDVPDTRTLTVMNKADLVTQEDLGDKMWMLGVKEASFVSAKTGSGIPELLQNIGRRLEGSKKRGM